MGPFSRLILFTEPRCGVVDFEEIGAYALKILKGTKVELRGPLLEKAEDGAAEDLPMAIARAKVRNGGTPVDPGQRVLDGEIAYERRRLQSRESAVFGLLYDAHVIADVYAGLMRPDETRLDCLSVVFTNQLIGTFDEGDRRYHARAVLCGSPSIVSISGLVEAPARARGYYIARRNAEAWGMAEDEKMELASSFAEDCLSHEDARLTEVAKGYVMQAAAYRLTGESFCEDPGCRLYNAHWQRELLEAQLGGDGEFCRKHSELFGITR